MTTEKSLSSQYQQKMPRQNCRQLPKNHVKDGNVNKVPAWIKTLVVKLKKVSREGWTSSFVKMTPATASTATYVSLIRNKHYEEKFTVSEDDESSNSSKEEDFVSKKVSS